MVTGNLGVHESDIEHMRHALKFLDDSKRGMAGVLADLECIAVARHQMFITPHKGLLGPFKRWLQCDLAILIDGGRLIGTSDLFCSHRFTERAAPASRIALSSFGPEISAQSFMIGRYIRALHHVFPIPLPDAPHPAPSPPMAVDVKGDAFYSAFLEPHSSREHALAMLLAALLSSANFVLYVLPAMLGHREKLEDWFLYKWRLITLFHVYSSLKRISASPMARRVLRAEPFNAIVSIRRSLKSVERLKASRHALVHYDLSRKHKTVGEQLALLTESNDHSVEESLKKISNMLSSYFDPIRA